MNKATHWVEICGERQEVYYCTLRHEWRRLDGRTLCKEHWGLNDNDFHLIEEEEPKTFDWLTAMQLYSEGVRLEGKNENGWTLWGSPETGKKDGLVYFYANMEYRLAPLPPMIDYSQDQGFKEGDIVMLSNEGKSWGPGTYGTYLKMNKTDAYPHGSNLSFYKFARPLTKEEYAKVKVQQ